MFNKQLLLFTAMCVTRLSFHEKMLMNENVIFKTARSKNIVLQLLTKCMFFSGLNLFEKLHASVEVQVRTTDKCISNVKKNCRRWQPSHFCNPGRSYHRAPNALTIPPNFTGDVIPTLTLLLVRMSLIY